MPRASDRGMTSRGNCAKPGRSAGFRMSKRNREAWEPLMVSLLGLRAGPAQKAPRGPAKRARSSPGRLTRPGFPWWWDGPAAARPPRGDGLSGGVRPIAHVLEDGVPRWASCTGSGACSPFPAGCATGPCRNASGPGWQAQNRPLGGLPLAGPSPATHIPPPSSFSSQFSKTPSVTSLPWTTASTPVPWRGSKLLRQPGAAPVRASTSRPRACPNGAPARCRPRAYVFTI